MTEEMHSYLESHWFRAAVFEIRQYEVGLTISGSSQASFSKKNDSVLFSSSSSAGATPQRLTAHTFSVACPDRGYRTHWHRTHWRNVDCSYESYPSSLYESKRDLKMSPQY
jgi:hypothetical protein